MRLAHIRLTASSLTILDLLAACLLSPHGYCRVSAER